MPNSEIFRIFSPSLAAMRILRVIIRHSPEESREHSWPMSNGVLAKLVPFPKGKGSCPRKMSSSLSSRALEAHRTMPNASRMANSG
jgi:hypothetical protein